MKKKNRTALELCGPNLGAKVQRVLQTHLWREMPQLMPRLVNQRRHLPSELDSELVFQLACGANYDFKFDFGGKLEFVNRLLGVLLIPFEEVVWPTKALTASERKFWLGKLNGKEVGVVARGDDGILPDGFIMELLIARSALAELCAPGETQPRLGARTPRQGNDA
jgi:hypothetical protein